jgi:hypothetical protein
MFPKDYKKISLLHVMRYGTAFAPHISAEQGLIDDARRRKTWYRIMTLHLGVLLLLGMTWSINANARQGERQDFGSGGIFSYVPPHGWNVVEFPGLKFKISRGAPVDGFAPNIVVVDEAYPKSLDDYVKDNTTMMHRTFHGLKILGQSDFKTLDGTRAIKEVIERNDDPSGKRLRQAFYFYNAGNKKLIATCTRLAETGSAQDAVCDASMKTFNVVPIQK